MRSLAREFYRVHLPIPLRFFIVTAICAVVMFFTGTYANEKLRIPAIAVSAFLLLLTLWALFDVLTAPPRFKKRLSALPEEERREITDGFGTEKKLGERWFLEKHLLYFAKRRIVVLRLDELRSADLKGNKLFLKLADGREVPFPFEADENPAVLVAVLRSKNSGLSATIDGTPVDFDKKNKGKEDVK